MGRKSRVVEAEITCDNCYSIIRRIADDGSNHEHWIFTVPTNLNPSTVPSFIKDAMEKRHQGHLVRNKTMLFVCRNCKNQDPSKMSIKIK